MSFKVITSCYGKKYLDAACNWIKQLRINDIENIKIIQLQDDYDGLKNAGIELVIEPYDENKLKWGFGDQVRLKHIMNDLRKNITCVQIDVDVYINKNIQPIVDLPYDFIISRGRYQPPTVMKKLGFVGCTGFYIAKPKSLKFMEDLYRNIVTNHYNTYLDQKIINFMIADLDWKKEAVKLGEKEVNINVANYNGISVCVLDQNTIFRGNNRKVDSYGYHWKTFIDLFLKKN